VVRVAAAQAVDADAAKALIKDNECPKCHAVDKEKKGPSYKKIAAKYKGKSDAEAKAIRNMTTGPKVKLDDGTEEDHKVTDTKDPARGPRQAHALASLAAHHGPGQRWADARRSVICRSRRPRLAGLAVTGRCAAHRRLRAAPRHCRLTAPSAG
jgi:cytochrome c